MTIRNSLKFLGVALVAVGLLSAGPAEARFGKRTDSEKSEKTEKGYRTKRSRSTGSHSASAVGSQPRHQHSGGGHVVVRPRPRYYRPWYGWGYAPRQTVIVHDHHYAGQPAPAPQAEQYVEPYESPFAVKRFELGGTAQPLLNGSVLGLNLLVDWKSLGIDLRFDTLGLRAEDGSGTIDAIRMFDATATFALIDGENGRLRAHLGAYSAFAPDIAFIGPGGGLSASADLFGPFTAEASAQFVVFPFTKIDTRAAMGLRLGPVEGRLGWRFTILDDQGRVDGVRNVDLMTGPYIGALLRL